MANFNISQLSAAFKIKYLKPSQNLYNSKNVVVGRVKKNYKFVGKQLELPAPLSFSGGVGSGSIPLANRADYGDVIITSKKLYASVEVDRETLKASATDEGAFYRFTKEVAKKGVESFVRNFSRTFFNDGTGALGTIAASGVSGSGPYVLTLTAFVEANWEEHDYVNIGTAGSPDASVYEVTAVSPNLTTPNSSTVTVAVVSGSHTPVAGDVVYMQGSCNNDPMGLKGVCDANSGSLYNVTVQRRWQSTELDASSAPISSDLINQAILDMERKTGEVPNMLMTSYTQLRKLLATMEDQKRYELPARSKDLKGQMSFTGVEFMSTRGPIGIFAERFCDRDRFYLLNDNYIEVHHRPDFGWFDDDGSVFMRNPNRTDTYIATYGGYLQTYIVPTFQGCIKNLSTT